MRLDDTFNSAITDIIKYIKIAKRIRCYKFALGIYTLESDDIIKYHWYKDIILNINNNKRDSKLEEE